MKILDRNVPGTGCLWIVIVGTLAVCAIPLIAHAVFA